MNENTSHTGKNEFIRSFLEESMAWQFVSEINWPLAQKCMSVVISNKQVPMWLIYNDFVTKRSTKSTHQEGL